MGRRTDDQRLVVRPAVGGLQTKYPPSAIASSESPDLRNVLFDKRSIRRREGMVPINRFPAPKNALRNRGYSWWAFPQSAGNNVDWKRVDGMGFAGHRPGLNAYDQVVSGLHQSNLTVSFLCSPEPGNRLRGYDQYGKGGLGTNGDVGTINWFRWNSLDGDGSGSHFVKMRPILSKGPIQTIEDVGYLDSGKWSQTVVGGEDGTGNPIEMAWRQNEQMPFCFSVYFTTQTFLNYQTLQSGQTFTEDRRIRGRTSGTTATILADKQRIEGGTGTIWIKYKTGGPFTAGEQIEDAGTSTLIATLNGGEQTVSGPAWRCSFFVTTVGTPTGRLVHLDSAIDNDFGPYSGHTYRLTFVCNSGEVGGGAAQRAWFRITMLKGDGTTRSHLISTAPNGAAFGSTDQVQGPLALNTQPVLFFEVPVAACRNHANPDRAFGIYWDKDVIPFEGKIEDIQLWSQDKSQNGVDWSFADTFLRLDRSDNSTLGSLMAYWAPDTVSEVRVKPEPEMSNQDKAYFPEGTNKDLPLILSPTVPLWQDANGRKSLQFDGRTAYGYMPTQALTRSAAAGTVVNSNYDLLAYILWHDDNSGPPPVGRTRPYSISMTIIPDSIEPGNEPTNDVPTQCCVDFDPVFRIGITSQGHIWAQAHGAPTPGAPGTLPLSIIGSILNGGVSGASANAYVAGVGISLANVITMIPGQRYLVEYRRIDLNNFKIIVNGVEQIVVTTVGAPAFHVDSPAMFTMILGTHCRSSGSIPTRPSATSHATYDATGTIYTQYNPMYFCGRIEDIRISIGQNLGATPAHLYQREMILDVQSVNANNTTTLTFADVNMRTISADSLLLRMPGPQIDFSTTLFANTIPKVFLTLSSTQATSPAPPTPVPGFYTLSGAMDGLPNGWLAAGPISARIEAYLAHWDWQTPPAFSQRQSRYYSGLENEPTTPRTIGLPRAMVYEEWGAIDDRCGFSLPIALRSRSLVRWSYRIGTDTTHVKDFMPNLYGHYTPYELKPRLATGLAIPQVDTNPITLISQLKKSAGNRFTIAGAGNSLYWLKPPWATGESPYTPDRDPNQVSAFFNGEFKNYNKRSQSVPAVGTTANGVSGSGQPNLDVSSTSNFAAGQQIVINFQGANTEIKIVQTVVSGTRLLLTTNLVNAHSTGEAVVRVDEMNSWVTRAATQLFTPNNDGLSLTVEFWMKIPEYARSVRRAIAICWDGTPNVFNWRLILHEEGLLGNESEAWSIGTSPFPTISNAGFFPTVADGKWHHVAFVMDERTEAATYRPTFDKIFVDGISQPVWVNGVKNLITSSFGLTTTRSLPVYIAGTPHDLLDPLPGTTGVGGAPFEVPILGWMRDFRVTRGIRYAKDFAPPTGPLQREGSISAPFSNLDLPNGFRNYYTIGLVGFSDGADQIATDAIPGNPPIEMRWNELVPLNDGDFLASNSSPRFPWEWSEYNETLYLTNGLGPPLALRHHDLFVYDASAYGRFAGVYDDTYAYRGTTKKLGFSLARFGTSAPGADDIAVSLNSGGGGSTLPAGTITIAVTFITEDGVESDPVIATRYTAGSATTLGIRVDNIPRSLESHVVRRRLYISGVSSSGATLWTREAKLDDNLSASTEVAFADIPGAGQLYLPTKAPPDPGRFLEFHRDRSYVLNFPTLENAARRASFSEPLEVESHSKSVVGLNVFNLESPEGNVGAGVREFMGRLYLFLRNSIYNLIPGNDNASFRKDRINTSIGSSSGFSIVTQDNRMYFRGEKGVYIFDAAGVHHISEALESGSAAVPPGFWSVLDPSDLAQLQSHGAYHQPTNQYWMTFRRKGEVFGTELLVYDAVIQDPLSQGSPWALMQGLPHSYLESIDAEFSDLPILALGTASGQVYELLSGDADGVRFLTSPVSGVPFVYTGTLGSSPWNFIDTLTIASGTLDTLGASTGLRGLYCRVERFSSDGKLLAYGQARILRNDATHLVVIDPFADEKGTAFTPAQGDIWTVAGIDAYWTSPWNPMTSPYGAKLARMVTMDFVPQAANLDVAVQGAIGPITTVQPFGLPTSIDPEFRRAVDMTRGHHHGENIHVPAHGAYWRMRIGTFGFKPFAVLGYEVSFDEIGTETGPKGA